MYGDYHTNIELRLLRGPPSAFGPGFNASCWRKAVNPSFFKVLGSGVGMDILG